MRRPPLREIPLDDAIPLRPGRLTVTMSPGQWDNLLLACYEGGDVLLELDDDERPVHAYQKADARREPRP